MAYCKNELLEINRDKLKNMVFTKAINGSNKENRIQRQQLAAIFSLMKENAETFGEMNETDIKEQLKLYDIAAARKQELQAPDTRLAQLQESDEEEDEQRVKVEATPPTPPVPGESVAPLGESNPGEAPLHLVLPCSQQVLCDTRKVRIMWKTTIKSGFQYMVKHRIPRELHQILKGHGTLTSGRLAFAITFQDKELAEVFSQNLFFSESPTVNLEDIGQNVHG
ncbi:UNVERIFIED_CONTAM: hypothetical protein K2H54_012593 [Gekko kuhli]